MDNETPGGPSKWMETNAPGMGGLQGRNRGRPSSMTPVNLLHTGLTPRSGRLLPTRTTIVASLFLAAIQYVRLFWEFELEIDSLSTYSSMIDQNPHVRVGPCKVPVGWRTTMARVQPRLKCKCWDRKRSKWSHPRPFAGYPGLKRSFAWEPFQRLRWELQKSIRMVEY